MRALWKDFRSPRGAQLPVLQPEMHTRSWLPERGNAQIGRKLMSRQKMPPQPLPARNSALNWAEKQQIQAAIQSGNVADLDNAGRTIRIASDVDREDWAIQLSALFDSLRVLYLHRRGMSLYDARSAVATRTSTTSLEFPEQRSTPLRDAEVQQLRADALARLSECRIDAGH
jgi:hypothetical protein